MCQLQADENNRVYSSQGRRSLWDRGDMSPPHNILEVMSLGCRLNCDSNCCLLYFNANIMCSFTKKFQLLGDFAPDPLSGLRPCTPLGSPDPQSSFMSPNNPVRSTPLIAVHNMPHRYGNSHAIQCCLLPGRGDIPAFTPDESWYSI